MRIKKQHSWNDNTSVLGKRCAPDENPSLSCASVYIIVSNFDGMDDFGDLFGLGFTTVPIGYKSRYVKK